MKILITGATGQVGHELQRTLQAMGEVIAVDRSRMDLSNLQQVRHVIRTVRPGLIVNAAAYTAVDQAQSEPALAMQLNAHAPAAMAEEAKRLDAVLIHFSTDYVFDGSKAGHYEEDDPTSPVNVYGESKRQGELAIAATGIPALIFRTQWVYGLHGKNFLLTMLRLAAQRTELRVVDDQVGAPTWARTLAEATAEVVRLGQGQDLSWWRERAGLYHLTAQGETSWCGFARRIVALSNLASKPSVVGIPTTDYPTPARRPANSRLSCEKFIRTFCALPDWDDALVRCMREQPAVASPPA
ncbi:dTDP-4-dehydrorhamnose reductase [Lacisediminimonas sp.]|uniref:dTDP-4-dehydrorhamnose reductase n=1 Tax=Lacisediminimonas sp. TaxID=3060582 RepID=UPI00271F490F|nr:dTDP-4-dehydrorhamnose reductase [Lacisediminimonas sp.]MDO8299435.1 dTDP-4-dehydrorhamnose reductase [Lacisediminimonas sp.]